ncbi:MAG: xanthine dehydrogenase family protein subunit M [Acidobacteria bacterium]|nr:xanthine dehydrogenase family protein subunit M [Acidobacteriota bacterium]
MSLPSFQYLAPRTGEELAGMLAAHREKARILAGGTDLINWMSEKALQPDYVIDLNGLPDLGRISYEKGKGLAIGAAVKIEAIEKSAVIREKYSSLSSAAGQIGSPQVRAMASIGGNICNASPCADMPPPLVTFGAAVSLVSRRGRREMPLEDFIRGNRQTALEADEFLELFRLPEPRPHSASRYAILGLRAAQEIDIASLAANLALDRKSGTIADVRIAMGAVAPTPMRAVRAEEILMGQKPVNAVLDRAAASCGDECRPIDDLRASAAYRRHVIRVLAGRVLREALAALA